MLDGLVVWPAAAKRLRASVFAAHLDGFCAWLRGLGYGVGTIRAKLRIVDALARWMVDAGVAVQELDERRAREFIEARGRRGLTHRGFERTAVQLIEHLRAGGVVAVPVVARDDSPGALLLARYEEFLVRERALAASTIAGYRSVVRAFVEERFVVGGGRPDALGAAEVRDFLLARARGVPPRRAQYVACALRSFMRFLFLRGETAVDLSLALPTVRRWRLASVPRDLPEGDVERLLLACDRSTATGRRNYAMLLLFARLGLRANEVMMLDLADLLWREGEIVVRAKGGARHRLPLLPDVGEALAHYLREGRPAGCSRRVFVCARAPHRGFSNPSSVSTVVARAFARAGLAPTSRGAHTLRHSLATAMMRRGASLAEVGEVLRHRSQNTTEIYAKLDFDALRDVALPWPLAGDER
jgi:integrase/recombinase XerD